MDGLITTDDYGRVPYELFLRMRRAHVSPTDWEEIRDSFILVGQQPVDFDQALRFIQAHIHGGIYICPWPFRPHQVMAA